MEVCLVYEATLCASRYANDSALAIPYALQCPMSDSMPVMLQQKSPASIVWWCWLKGFSRKRWGAGSLDPIARFSVSGFSRHLKGYDEEQDRQILHAIATSCFA